MRYLIVLLLCGCASEPASICANEDIRLGGQLRHMNGQLGTIEKIYGRSDRCPEKSLPFLVDVRFE